MVEATATVVAKLLSVFALAAIELWAAIPAGLALRLHPVVVGVTSAAGAISGTLAVALLGARLRSWLLRRHAGKDSPGRPGLIQRVWRRYGVAGLGLLAPVSTGAPLGVALGLALGAPVGRLALWSTLGIVLWSAILTAAAALGLAGIGALVH